MTFSLAAPARSCALLVLAQACLRCSGAHQAGEVRVAQVPQEVPMTGPAVPVQSPQDRADAIKPVAWVHVPKCGSSFLNALLSNPSLCPNRAAGRWLPESSDGLEVSAGSTATSPGVWDPIRHFIIRNGNNETCPGAFAHLALEPFVEPLRAHAGIGAYWERDNGHGVTVLRQPEQRMISAFHFHLASGSWQHPIIENLPEYARAWQGCFVKMLIREHSGRQGMLNYPCFNYTDPEPTPEEDAVAVYRLRTGFAFVGIQEEWELTVCLWHAMFGGYCHPEEFGNMREGPARNSSEQLYDTADLEGWTDPHDGPIYEVGLRIFNANLHRYGVTRENCPAYCQPPEMNAPLAS